MVVILQTRGQAQDPGSTDQIQSRKLALPQQDWESRAGQKIDKDNATRGPERQSLDPADHSNGHKVQMEGEL